MTARLFPISLSGFRAEKLVDSNEELNKLFREKSRFLYREAEYDFSASLLNPEGDVEVVVTYRSDDGFCISSGPVFRHTLRPFSDKTVTELIDLQKNALAYDEYDRRQELKVKRAVAKIKKEMFG